MWVSLADNRWVNFRERYSLNGLILVNPNRVQWLDGIKMAPGAEEILEEALIHNSLEEAISDMHLVIGTSRRIRKHRLFLFNPEEVFADLFSMPPHFKIALVFGSERNGLTNFELSLCQRVVVIPTSSKLPSINLAQAVMILAYEWHKACTGKHLSYREGKGADKESFNAEKNVPVAEKIYKIARVEQRQRLIEHANMVIKRIGFCEGHSEKGIMLTLIDILSRVDLTEREVAILRGMLSRIEYVLDNKDR